MNQEARICPACRRSIPASAEVCECGWFSIPKSIPQTTGQARRSAREGGAGSRILGSWGGACGFLAGAAFPQKGALVAMALFAAGYFASEGILNWLHNSGRDLTTARGLGLAALYFVGAIVVMIASDLAFNR